MNEIEEKLCRCSKCQAEGKVKIYHIVEVDKIKEILDSSLFFWKCPECGAKYRFIYPCLFIHDKKKYAVRYRGESKQERLPRDLTGFQKRDCTSLEELSEKVRVFESGLDDQVMELVKLLTFAKLHVEDDSIEKIYFYQKNNLGNLEFTIFRGKQPDGIEVPYQVYSNIVDLSQVLPKLKDEFHEIDLNWAGRQVVDH